MFERRLAALACFVAAMLLTVEASAQQGRQRGQQQQQQQQEGQQQDGQRQQREDRFPQDITWTAVSFNGRVLSGTTTRPSFRLDQQFRMRGFGGCNTFSATAYPVRNQGLAVGPMALTRMSCDKAVLDFEREFLTALRNAQNWALQQGRLVVRTNRGPIEFERAL